MELKRYTEFKRKIAVLTTAAVAGSTDTDISTHTATSTATDRNCNKEGRRNGNIMNDPNNNDNTTNNSHTSNSFPSVDHKHKRTKLESSQTLSPSSNNSNSNNNSSIPFATSNWWKNGNGPARVTTPTLAPENATTAPPSSWLQLLGEVAALGENKQNSTLQQQQQQHNQAVDDPLLSALVFPTNSTGGIGINNNAYHQQQQQTSSAPSAIGPSTFSSASSQQQQQQEPNYPFSFPPIANMRPLSYNYNTNAQHHSYLQQQQQHHQQQQQQQQQHYHQLQQQQQQQQRHAATAFQSFPGFAVAGGGSDQQRQRQQIQQPLPVRVETNIIDTLRAEGGGGDINLNISDMTDVGGPASLDVERELEESYQQDASFADDLKQNAQQQPNDTIIDVDDVDLDFSDIEPVPAMATSGSITLMTPRSDSPKEAGEGFDINDNDIGNDGSNTNRLPNTPITPNSNNNNTLSSTEIDYLKEVKFRAYQAENWTEKFEELLQFRDDNGHCLVPNCHPENPALAQWTKRQRYQYKLKIDGKRSTITDERVRALDEVGFVWDSHKAVWSERLEELKCFQKEFGHCNVPSRYQTNHQLAIWVKRQRRQWKNRIDLQPNCMTDERQDALEELGFLWDMKRKKMKKTTNKKRKMIVV